MPRSNCQVGSFPGCRLYLGSSCSGGSFQVAILSWYLLDILISTYISQPRTLLRSVTTRALRKKSYLPLILEIALFQPFTKIHDHK